MTELSMYIGTGFIPSCINYNCSVSLNSTSFTTLPIHLLVVMFVERSKMKIV